MFESQTVLRPIKFEVSIRLNLKVTINFTSTEIYAKWVLDYLFANSQEMKHKITGTEYLSYENFNYKK